MAGTLGGCGINGIDGVELTLESGRVIRDVTEPDILAHVEGEEFAILAVDEDTYLQCAQHGEPPYEYVLEYREGSGDRHFQATDAPMTLDRVLSAFIRYRRGDPSWKADFQWERLEL